MSDQLQTYRAKRDFAQTQEPDGSGPHSDGTGTRFVIQRHDARALHFDLRLEHDGVLHSWAVPKGVPLRAPDKRLAVRTEAHPLSYLEFAGTIPAGQYGAGRMTIWDTGRLEILTFDDDEVKCVLHGEVIAGEYHLVRTDADQWLVFRARAAGAGPESPVERFRSLRPMLASPAPQAFDDPDWAFEIKWDGYRALALVTGDGVEIRSRSGRDMTATYPRLADLRRAIDSQEAILDGEICVLDDAGRSVFQDLQAGNGPVTFIAFDLLYADGVWYDHRPFDERRQRLREVLAGGVLGHVLVSDDVPGEGSRLFKAVAESGGEGIVAKRRSSVYRPGGRSPDWRKIKVRRELDGVVCGFLPGEGSRKDTFGALAVATRNDDGQLEYVGRVGSGFTDPVARSLRTRLDRLVTPASALDRVPPDLANATWVRPVMECRVAYSEMTADGIMRAPVFMGMAEHEPTERPAPLLDLSGQELRVRDDGREIRLTNLGKVFWGAEAITKGDVLDHYARLSPALLPHLADRPMVLKRYPNGVDAPFFFQHQIPETAPGWLPTIRVNKGDDQVDYAIAADGLALLWVVNLGCIDLNPWHARVGSLTLADYVLFDLDPQDGVGFDQISEAALEIQTVLSSHGLEGVPKTSGSRGMHILVPVVPTAHETVRLYAQLVAAQVLARRPELVTVEVTKARRGARVYIDTNQNGYGKTIASVYSIRPVPGATISTPVTWDEVAAGVDAARFTLGAVAERVSERGDLFSRVLERDQDLEAVIAGL